MEPAGIGGVKISVRMRVFVGEESSSLARIWPMNPPAPVMRMCILKYLDVVLVFEGTSECIRAAVLSDH